MMSNRHKLIDDGLDRGGSAGTLPYVINNPCQIW